MNNSPSRTVAFPFLLWVGYLLFLVYGSLVPLKYQARPLAEAWGEFQQIPFLNLGSASRADWIANGVLYLPMAFLTGYLVLMAIPRGARFLALPMAGLLCMGLAVAVEFGQVYFPARTVSQNDVMAEWIGSWLGVALVARYFDWFKSLLGSLADDPNQLRPLILDAYAIGYLAFALFPYDTLITWTEIESKIMSDRWGWLLAGSISRPSLVILQVCAEFLLTVPFGVLLVRCGGRRFDPPMPAILVGAILGLAIEVAQFFLVSGISQGLSVINRTAAVWCGVWIAVHPRPMSFGHLAAQLRRHSMVLGAVYLIALLVLNGWFRIGWHGIDEALLKAGQVQFIPFYRHYYTSESKALFSLAAVGLSYLPLVLIFWARALSPGLAVAFAALLATGIETSKLFFRGASPDVTNVWIAMIATWLGIRLLGQMTSARHPETTVDAAKIGMGGDLRLGFPAMLFFALCAAAYWVATFPVFQGFVAIVLVMAATAVWYRPSWLIAIVPAALPVFDLAPWSGRFFVDEYDALLVVCLAVAYARSTKVRAGDVGSNRLLFAAVILVGLSFAVSCAIALWPLQAPDANSFNNYYSPYNAIRIAKGAVWAGLVVLLSRRFVSNGQDPRVLFAWGLMAGLAMTVAVILWERIAFSGLWNFTNDYRATGPFSAIHTGGAYIECFIAVCVPYLLILLFKVRSWWLRLVLLALLLGATYALMVTFARIGYVALGVAIVASIGAMLFSSARPLGKWLALAGIAGAVLLVAAPIFKGQFAQARFATIQTDLGTRLAHWREALRIRDPDWTAQVFGMGLGRFPDTSFWRSSLVPRSGTYRLLEESGNTYLRLGSGDSIYVEQIVPVVRDQQYLLKMDVRTSSPGASLTFPICEKWLLTSVNCIWHTLKVGKTPDVWTPVEIRLVAKDLAKQSWYSRRTTKFSLYLGVPKSTVDVDNLRLEISDGQNLIRNGDFAQRFDHWFFATDGHLQWHVKSLFYGTLFDQGLFGVAAMGLFIALVLAIGLHKSYRGDELAMAGVGSLLSFLVVGAFDTLIDTPRFLLLLLMLAWVCTVDIGGSKRKDNCPWAAGLLQPGPGAHG